MRFVAAISKVDKQMLRYQRLKEWHAWFAWKPVLVKDNKDIYMWVWFEWVMRRWIPRDPTRDASLALWDYDFPAWYY